MFITTVNRIQNRSTTFFKWTMGRLKGGAEGAVEVEAEGGVEAVAGAEEKSRKSNRK